MQRNDMDDLPEDHLAMKVVEARQRSGLPAEIGRDSWGDLMTDVRLWQPVIKDIWAAVDLQMGDGLAVGYPGSCAVFLVDGQAVIKLYPPLFAKDFHIELAVYRSLQDRLESIPKLLYSGIYRERIEWPFLIFRLCPGEPIRVLHEQLSREGKIQIARQVGEVIRAVHQTDIIDKSPFTPWKRFLQQRYRDCLKELREDTLIPEFLLSDIASFLAMMLPELIEEDVVLLNADLTEDHILVSDNDGAWRLQAIIDWADAEIGAPAYEWIAAWFGMCRQDASMFQALVSACTPQQKFDEIFWRKLLAYTFLHRFGPLIIREQWQLEPPLGELSLTVLQKWLWPLAN